MRIRKKDQDRELLVLSGRYIPDRSKTEPKVSVYARVGGLEMLPLGEGEESANEFGFDRTPFLQLQGKHLSGDKVDRIV